MFPSKGIVLAHDGHAPPPVHAVEKGCAVRHTDRLAQLEVCKDPAAEKVGVPAGLQKHIASGGIDAVCLTIDGDMALIVFAASHRYVSLRIDPIGAGSQGHVPRVSQNDLPLRAQGRSGSRDLRYLTRVAVQGKGTAGNHAVLSGFQGKDRRFAGGQQPGGPKRGAACRRPKDPIYGKAAIGGDRRVTAGLHLHLAVQAQAGGGAQAVSARGDKRAGAGLNSQRISCRHAVTAGLHRRQGAGFQLYRTRKHSPRLRALQGQAAGTGQAVRLQGRSIRGGKGRQRPAVRHLDRIRLHPAFGAQGALNRQAARYLRRQRAGAEKAPAGGDSHAAPRL